MDIFFIAHALSAIGHHYHKGSFEEEKNLYQNAANRFRLPFWDPLLPRNKVDNTGVLDNRIWGIPKILGAKDVWVKRLNAIELESIPNSLYQFTFPQNEVLQAKGRKPVIFGSGVVSHLRTPFSLKHTQFDVVLVRAGEETYSSNSWFGWRDSYL